MLPAQPIQLAERPVPGEKASRHRRWKAVQARLNWVTVSRLLIADDDESVRFALASVLRSEGYHVDEAADGVAAAERGTAGSYALVILDVEMPGMNGLEVCRRIRKLRPATSILMLTGRAEELDTIAGLDAGADDYVIKPFRVAELLARVRAHVRRAPADEVVAGEVKLDRLARRAFCGDEELHLSPKEFELLEHLVTHAGRTVTRQQMTEALWGEWYGSPKTLDMHVLALRRKLKDDAHAPRYIKTVRGVGLRFEV
jgi:DNA-binding response OmpR family regulator